MVYGNDLHMTIAIKPLGMESTKDLFDINKTPEELKKNISVVFSDPMNIFSVGQLFSKKEYFICYKYIMDIFDIKFVSLHPEILIKLTSKNNIDYTNTRFNNTLNDMHIRTTSFVSKIKEARKYDSFMYNLVKEVNEKLPDDLKISEQENYLIQLIKSRVD